MTISGGSLRRGGMGLFSPLRDCGGGGTECTSHREGSLGARDEGVEGGVYIVDADSDEGES